MRLASMSFVALFATTALPAAAFAQSFEGPYVGAQAGWTQNKIENPTTDLGVAPIDASKDSASLGGYAGYDKEFGRFVLGTELGLGIGTSDTIASGTGANLVSIDPKRSFDWTARAGYLVSPDTLVYGRGGYTNDRIRTTVTTPTGPVSASENRDGWLLGGGVERKLTSNLSARLEYRYADLSEGDSIYDRHQVLTGITFRF